MSDELTLRHYEISSSKIPYATIELATEAADRVGGVVAFPVDSTYQVGQAVRVHSFGRWRPGVVTKLGRTRVTVDYQSNQQGGRRTKAFASGEILPR